MKGAIMYQLFILLITSSVVTKGEDIKVGASRINNNAIHNFIKEKNLHFLETFNDRESFKKQWIISEAKKEGFEGDLAKYDGDWFVGSPSKHQLQEDYGLSFKQRAKHRAISALLSRDFEFVDKPFVLQYEVLFQDGQECGGGYLKLITGSRDNVNLKDFHDKTPYTIMFGPDKCGSTSKLHFIFRHKNPLNGSFEEKHCKPVTSRIDDIFIDDKPHLFGLVILPDNTYKILLDHKIINEGSLLTDFTPPVNPPAEVDDPTDSKPADWDDREHISDPDATKPADWDETEPHMIPDPTAVKPENWLDNEPLYIRDPSAEKPHDWDVEMDGEWEAPLVPNPACEDAGGCGEWTPPKIHNPAYKGKWAAPIIPNPNYKGKWTPKKIPNIHFFEDNHPFKMEKIVAVGFELWSMSPNILFDNVLLTDSENNAKRVSELTFDVKMLIIVQSADTILNQFVAFTNKYPWLWAVYTVILLILVTLIVYCCFSSFKDNSDHQRPDRPQPDGGDDSAPLLSEEPEAETEEPEAETGEPEAETGEVHDMEGESLGSCDSETGNIRPVADGGDHHEVKGEAGDSPRKGAVAKDFEEENVEDTERPDGDPGSADQLATDSSADNSAEGNTVAGPSALEHLTESSPDQFSAVKESQEGVNIKKND